MKQKNESKPDTFIANFQLYGNDKQLSERETQILETLQGFTQTKQERLKTLSEFIPEPATVTKVSNKDVLSGAAARKIAATTLTKLREDSIAQYKLQKRFILNNYLQGDERVRIPEYNGSVIDFNQMRHYNYKAAYETQGFDGTMVDTIQDAYRKGLIPDAEMSNIQVTVEDNTLTTGSIDQQLQRYGKLKDVLASVSDDIKSINFNNCKKAFQGLFDEAQDLQDAQLILLRDALDKYPVRQVNPQQFVLPPPRDLGPEKQQVFDTMLGFNPNSKAGPVFSTLGSTPHQKDIKPQIQALAHFIYQACSDDAPQKLEELKKPYISDHIKFPKYVYKPFAEYTEDEIFDIFSFAKVTKLFPKFEVTDRKKFIRNIHGTSAGVGMFPFYIQQLMLPRMETPLNETGLISKPKTTAGEGDNMVRMIRQYVTNIQADNSLKYVFVYSDNLFVIAYIRGKVRWLSMDGSSMESTVSSHFIKLALFANLAKSVGAHYEIFQTRPTNALECDYDISTDVHTKIPSSVTNYVSRLAGPLSTGLLGTIGHVQFPSHGLGSGVHLTSYANGAKMFTVRQLLLNSDLDQLFIINGSDELQLTDFGSSYIKALTGVYMKLEREFTDFDNTFWDIDFLGSSFAQVPGTELYVSVLQPARISKALVFNKSFKKVQGLLGNIPKNDKIQKARFTSAINQILKMAKIRQLHLMGGWLTMPKTLMNLFVKFVTYKDTQEIAALLMDDDVLRADLNSIIRTELSIDSDIITKGSIMYSLGMQPPSIERVIRTMISDERAVAFKKDVNEQRLHHVVDFADVIQLIDMTDAPDDLTQAISDIYTDMGYTEQDELAVETKFQVQQITKLAHEVVFRNDNVQMLTKEYVAERLKEKKNKTLLINATKLKFQSQTAWGKFVDFADTMLMARNYRSRWNTQFDSMVKQIATYYPFLEKTQVKTELQYFWDLCRDLTSVAMIYTESRDFRLPNSADAFKQKQDMQVQQLKGQPVIQYLIQFIIGNGDFQRKDFSEMIDDLDDIMPDGANQAILHLQATIPLSAFGIDRKQRANHWRGFKITDSVYFKPTRFVSMLEMAVYVYIKASYESQVHYEQTIPFPMYFPHFKVSGKQQAVHPAALAQQFGRKYGDGKRKIMVEKESIPILRTLTYSLFTNTADIIQAVELTSLNIVKEQVEEIQRMLVEYKDADYQFYVNVLLSNYMDNIIDITQRLNFVVSEVQVHLFFHVLAAAVTVKSPSATKLKAKLIRKLYQTVRQNSPDPQYIMNAASIAIMIFDGLNEWSYIDLAGKRTQITAIDAVKTCFTHHYDATMMQNLPRVHAHTIIEAPRPVARFAFATEINNSQYTNKQMSVENVRFRLEPGIPLLFHEAETVATMIVNRRCSTGQAYMKALLRTIFQFDPNIVSSEIVEGQRITSTQFLRQLKLKQSDNYPQQLNDLIEVADVQLTAIDMIENAPDKGDNLLPEQLRPFVVKRLFEIQKTKNPFTAYSGGLAAVSSVDEKQLLDSIARGDVKLLNFVLKKGLEQFVDTSAITTAKYMQLEIFKEKELPLDAMPTHLTSRELQYFVERKDLDGSQILNVFYTVAIGNYMRNPYQVASQLLKQHPAFVHKSWLNTSDLLVRMQQRLNGNQPTSQKPKPLRKGSRDGPNLKDDVAVTEKALDQKDDIAISEKALDNWDTQTIEQKRTSLGHYLYNMYTQRFANLSERTVKRVIPMLIADEMIEDMYVNRKDIDELEERYVEGKALLDQQAQELREEYKRIRPGEGEELPKLDDLVQGGKKQEVTNHIVFEESKVEDIKIDPNDPVLQEGGESDIQEDEHVTEW